jgi:hypothetical protein
MDLGILDEFLDVVAGIESGFPLKSSIRIDSSRIYKNHNSAMEHPSVIEDMIASEVAAGRFVGPFSQTELEGLIASASRPPLRVTTDNYRQLGRTTGCHRTLPGHL